MNEATKKIDTEIEKFRKKMFLKKPEDIYHKSINSIFMEGTAYYTNQLADASEDLSKLILVEGKTLEQCAEHVMNKARSVCGGMGADLPTEQFHAFIWEYYKMPVEKAKTAIEDAQKRRKEESVIELAEMRKKSEKEKLEAEAKKANEPKQLSLADMFAMAAKNK